MIADHIPSEMKAAWRWLLWRLVTKQGSDKPSKVPYYTTGKARAGGKSLDTEADVSRLTTFPEALAAFSAAVSTYAGLGFALGPDGTGSHWQGIDLDHVREKGLAELVNELPSYVESSPSGDGVHAIGYGKPFKPLGSNASGIEAYSEKRYFTVTGDVVIGDSLCDLSGFVADRLADLHASDPVAHRDHRDHRGTEAQSTQRSQDLQDFHESQESQAIGGRAAPSGKKTPAEIAIHDLPANCLPTAVGHRNRVLFNLARHLKTAFPDAAPNDCTALVKRWHTEALDVIGTKDWMTTWGDFATAWKKIKYLEGEGILDDLLADIDQTEPPPPGLAEIGYDETMWAIVRLLKRLSEESPDGVFFISGRTLGELFGISQRTASNFLLLTTDNGLIELIEKGDIKGRKASTYRFVGNTDVLRTQCERMGEK